MSVAFDKPSWWQRIKPVFQGFDLPLILIAAVLCAIGLVNM
jgi:rod shape determining protein RodA